MFKIYDGREHFYQWDLDRKLIIDSSDIKEVHFCNRLRNCSLMRKVYEVNGMYLVDVPNIILQQSFRMNVYAYDGNYTKYATVFEIKPRSKPETYVYTDSEVECWESLDERITALEEREVEIDLTDYATKEYVNHSFAGIFDAGAATEGYVDECILNTEERLTKEIDSLYDYIDDSISSAIGASITLTSDNFTNGLYTKKTGIVASDYFISSGAIPITIGEKISVKFGDGVDRVNWYYLDSEDLVNANILNNSKSTDSIEFASEYNAWLVITLYCANRITVNSYRCEIIIGESKLNTLEEEIEDIKNTVEALGNAENTIITTLSKSPKYKPFISITDDCQDINKWNGVDFTADTENYILGNQSLHCTNTLRNRNNVYDLENNYLVLKLKINSISGSGVSLYLRLGNYSNINTDCLRYNICGYSANTPYGVWLDVAIPVNSYAYYTGSLENVDITKIDDVTLYCSGGTVDFNLQYVGIMPKALKKGIVSFTFDDGWKTQYTGAKILAEKGITATVYPSSLEIQEGNANFLTVAEMQDMKDYFSTDFEVHGSNTYDEMTLEEIEAEWTKQQKLLRENGLGKGEHMAYPGGRHPADVVRLAKRFFTSCRTIQSYRKIEAFPCLDNYRLNATTGVGASGVNVEQVKELIDRAALDGSWLILVFHRIEDGTDSMYCSEDDLRAIADYAITSNVDIMNIAEVYDSTIQISKIGG